MNEQEFLACEDPQRMLDYICGHWSDLKVKISRRKARMLCIAIESNVSDTWEEANYPDDPLLWLSCWLRGTRGQPTEKEAFIRAAALLRDVAGNPFRPLWPTAKQYFARLASDHPLIRDLAEAAYSHRQADGTLDPFRLALVADALLDSGCDCAELLDHLRGPGPHVRGCFAIDTILGKK